MLILSLFTARVVFNTLGVENYGIYGLVGGIIVFFAFLNNGLSSATKKFVTSSIVDGDDFVSHTFNTCIIAHLIISIIVLLLSETIGLWIVNNVLNIPNERIYAANWVYQLSVIAAILGIIQSPFGALIVAYEKMNIYAYFTVLDVIFKLLVIYLVQYIGGDKLIIYSILIFIVTLINMIIYRIYTYSKFPFCRLKNIRFDRKLLREIFSFTSWSLFGQAAVVGTNQGTGVLVNIYNSVVVNAAMGIGSSITSTVQGFVSNFQIAFNPQIIKSYVSKEYDYLNSLIIRSSKLSGFLIIIFLVPLLFETENVLMLWLGKDVPKYSATFCILTLFVNYLEALSAPLWMMIYSQSNIKRYQIVISLVYIMNFFGAWLVLSFNMVPYSVIVVNIVVFFFLLLVRLYYVSKFMENFNKNKWFKQVFLRGWSIIAISYILTYITRMNFSFNSFVSVVFTTCISLFYTLPLMYYIGLDKNEKKYIKGLILNKIGNIKTIISNK